MVGTGEETVSSVVAEVRRVVELIVVVVSGVGVRMGSTMGVVWVMMRTEDDDEEDDNE